VQDSAGLVDRMQDRGFDIQVKQIDVAELATNELSAQAQMSSTLD
jgi:hypothetical protein